MARDVTVDTALLCAVVARGKIIYRLCIQSGVTWGQKEVMDGLLW